MAEAPPGEAGAALSKLEAALQGATVLDANAANELKQQQLNLKLKVKVREQKLQQRIGELEGELVAARKSVSVADFNHKLRPCFSTAVPIRRRLVKLLRRAQRPLADWPRHGNFAPLCFDARRLCYPIRLPRRTS